MAQEEVHVGDSSSTQTASKANQLPGKVKAILTL